MPTDTARGPSPAIRFALRSVAWSLGLFGLLRLPWIEAHAILPFTQVQAALASGLLGAPVLAIDFTLACSGTDALALCLGTILAYPVPWRRRLTGAAGGAALILGLNIVRLGTLGRVAASPRLFDALHIYVWPAILTLAIAGYVFGWMRVADGGGFPLSGPPQATRRFVALTAAFLVVFAAASPLYLESRGVLGLATLVARVAAAGLGAAGLTVRAAGNVLWTPRGGFLVTQECISTPLIPVYLAAVCAYASTWPRLAAGVAATVPLFTALGIARLLVVALPDAVSSSPLFLVHAFYQLLLAAVVVVIAALWRHGSRTAPRHAIAGLAAGVLFVYLLGPLCTRAVTAAAGAPLDDPQGAIAFLPAFQIGLYLALWIAAFAAFGWPRFFAGLAVLEVTQVAGLLALHSLTAQAGLTAHVRDIRGWAVAGPLLIVAVVVNRARARR